MSIAYLGVENSIEMIGFKPNGKLSFSITNGVITDLGQNNYVLKPSRLGECKISFQNKGRNIATKNFRVDTLGNLIARLAGVKDSFATIQVIITNPFLILEFPKTFYKHTFYIRSFELSMDEPGFEDSDPYEIVGCIIPAHVIKKIKQLRKGDHILFDQIIVQCPDCRARKLPPFQIIIK
jgi:hypothetical protein